MKRRLCASMAGVTLVMATAAAATGATAVAGPVHTASAHRLLAGKIGGPLSLRGARPDAGGSPWSGYAASSSTYKTVTASWVEPTLTCKGGDQHAAAWAGLDGYGTQTVEQTGSDFGCNGTKALYGAWYEMYPAAPVYYSVTVKAGDDMTASVAYTSGKYTLVLSDSTQGWSKTTIKTLSSAKRASAEAIIEADAGSVPDFGTVKFSSVEVDGSGIGSSSPTKLTLGGNADKVSALTGGDAFSITWLKK